MARLQKCGGVHRKSQSERDCADIRVSRRSTSEHRPATRQASKDNVEPGVALQPDGIDDGVEESPQKNIQRGPGIERDPCSTYGKQRQCANDQQPDRATTDLARRERTFAGARHQGVEIALVILVEGPGAGRGYQHGKRQNDNLPPAQSSAGADGQPGQRRKSNDDTNAQLEHTQNGTN